MNAYQASKTVMHVLTTPISITVNTRDAKDQYDYVAQNGPDKMTQHKTDIPIITEACTNVLSNSDNDQNQQFSSDFFEMVEPASIISIVTIAILFALS